MPKLYIISGCNGAGKTTASYTILPEMLNCREFVNADEIARGLSPFNPESVAIEAGRLMLLRIKELIAGNINFAFETTLATRSYTGFISEAKKRGYQVMLLFFWLNTPELAVDRVRMRAASGGHFVDEKIVRRRYAAGIKNLFGLYMDKCDYWLLIDNSKTPFEVIAEGEKNKTKRIMSPSLYKILENYERS